MTGQPSLSSLQTISEIVSDSFLASLFLRSPVPVGTDRLNKSLLNFSSRLFSHFVNLDTFTQPVCSVSQVPSDSEIPSQRLEPEALVNINIGLNRRRRGSQELGPSRLYIFEGSAEQLLYHINSRHRMFRSKISDDEPIFPGQTCNSYTSNI